MIEIKNITITIAIAEGLSARFVSPKRRFATTAIIAGKGLPKICGTSKAPKTKAKTISDEKITEGIISGKVTKRNLCQAVAPKFRATSVNWSSTRAKTANTTKATNGVSFNRYAKIIPIP